MQSSRHIHLNDQHTGGGNMKKITIIWTVALFMVSILSITSDVSARIIVVAHVFATDHPVHQSLLMADKWLREQSNGQFEFKIYPATTYATQADSYKAVMLGTLDVFNLTNSFNLYKPSGVLLAPYAFRDYSHWNKFKNSKTCEDLFNKAGEIMNVKHLSYFNFGFRHATTKNTIAKTPEDFKNLKIRVVNIPPYQEASAVLGATGAPIPLAELYMALATGVVDGQENPFSQTYYLKFYEQQKYLILTGHMLAADGWMMSKKCWNSLSEKEKEVVLTAFKKSADYIDEETIRQETDLLAKLKGYGMISVEVDKAPFMERAKGVLTKYPEWLEPYEAIQAIK
jgi:TRAP-type transport system periplasmic protein